MKRIFLLICISIIPLGLTRAQSATCAGATNVVEDGATCPINQNVNDITFETTANNTDICGTTEDVFRESWYRFTATATTASIAWVSNRAPAIEVFSGACGALVQIGCANNVLGTSNPQTEIVDLTGLTIGNVYLVRIINTANNNITASGRMCITSNTFAMDCGQAHPVCSDVAFSANAPGFQTQELNAGNTGCLNTFEHQTTWFGFSPVLTGTLEFLITPTAGAVDYDFAVWGPYNGPNCPVTGAPLRCSYSANPVPTGCSFGETNVGDLSEPAGGSGSADGLVRPITIAAGDIGKVYYLVVDNYAVNFTPFTLDWTFSVPGMLDCTPPLPIVISGFDGEPQGKTNYVYWNTQIEINNSHFVVEKSSDGVNYTDMTRVEGLGNSNSLNTYDVVDQNPFGTTYYRLKQVDFDGQFKYYGPISITNTDASEISVQNLYPNPADASFFIDVYAKEALDANIAVYNSYGQEVYNKVATVDGSTRLEINSDSWSTGFYIVKITNDEKHFQHIERVVIK